MSDPCAHFDVAGRCELGRPAHCSPGCRDYCDDPHLEFLSVAQMFARLHLWQSATDGEDPMHAPAQAQAGAMTQEPGSGDGQ